MFAYRSRAILVSTILLATASVRADDTPRKPERLATVTPADSTPESTTIASVAKPLTRPWVSHANVGVVAMSWAGATAAAPGQMTTIASRQTVVQMFGAGRYVTRDLRVMLGVQLAETVGGAPAGSSTLGMVGIVPWLGWRVAGPVYLGAGPLIAPRIYGKNQLDLGVFTAGGVTFPIGNGFALGAAVSVPMMFRIRTAVSVAPSTFLAYRF
jgi:hypothetical protein